MTSARGGDGCENGRRPALARANRPLSFGLLELGCRHACLTERPSFRDAGCALPGAGTLPYLVQGP